MAQPQYTYEYTQDLRKALVPQNAGGILVSGDENMALLKVNATQDGQPYTLTGACELKCIRADGETVRVTGAVSGSAASAVISADCCAAPGPMTALLQVAGVTLLVAQFDVRLGQTDDYIPPAPAIVPIERGGTGLTASPSLLVNLASAAAASVFQANPRPGVTGILPIANGGTGASTASAALASLGLNQQVYIARGAIVKSASTGTTVGSGIALVNVIGKAMQIDFEAHITTAGTLGDNYDVGIQPDTLRAINGSIPAFAIANSGLIHYYTDGGIINTSMEGYGGEAVAVPELNRWHFGRMYTQEGAIGAWSDAAFTAGLFIIGTLHGVLP